MGSSQDPEAERVGELARLVREGRATEAEREELALYAEESDQVQALVKRADHESEVGSGWLARAEADRRMTEAETTPFTRTERRVGVALMVTGGLGTFLFPPAVLAAIAGGAILTWSVLRVKVKTLGKDPYKDIKQ